MTRLGFVGLGIMGRAMVENLLAAGHAVTVWNRTPSKTLGLNATVAGSAADVGRVSDIAFVCVSNTPDVEEVVFGNAGLMEGLVPGAMIVDHSTISPMRTGELAAMAATSGIQWVDAPVSGGSEGASEGTLAIMAGGDSAAVERARPYLAAYSSAVVHIGAKPGDGQMAKAVNQILVVLNQLAVSEALLLAQAAGLDLARTITALEGGAGGSWMLSRRGPQMIARDWAPGFTIDLQQKDLRLVLDAADRLGIPLPGVALVFQLYRSLQARGKGGEGNHALVKALEELSGMRLGG